MQVPEKKFRILNFVTKHGLKPPDRTDQSSNFFFIRVVTFFFKKKMRSEIQNSLFVFPVRGVLSSLLTRKVSTSCEILSSSFTTNIQNSTATMARECDRIAQRVPPYPLPFHVSAPVTGETEVSISTMV